MEVDKATAEDNARRLGADPGDVPFKVYEAQGAKNLEHVINKIHLRLERTMTHVFYSSQEDKYTIVTLPARPPVPEGSPILVPKMGPQR